MSIGASLSSCCASCIRLPPCGDCRMASLACGMSVRLTTGRPHRPFQNSTARSRSRTLMQYCARMETTASPLSATVPTERVAFCGAVDVKDREVDGSGWEVGVAPLHALTDVGNASFHQRVQVTRGEHEELVVEDRLVHDVGHLRRRCTVD